MTNMRLLIVILSALAACLGWSQERIVIAYVTSWTDWVPDPQLMTHINYAFGHVNDDFSSVRIDKPDRLRQMVELKQQKPDLKVLLSIGGWGSGNFSEMAANDQFRSSFANDCKALIEQYGLDGVDIDWEYPTSSLAGISCSPADKDNFTLLMRDLRQAIGPDKLLTLASACTPQYIDFPAVMPYVDLVNVMAYDMGRAPSLHAGLHHSDNTLGMSADEAVEAHIKAGVPKHKLVMGMPFYGRGGEKYHDFEDFRATLEHTADSTANPRFTENWDAKAEVPYLTDDTGEIVFSYENEKSIAAKCHYILSEGLRGGMYWSYGADSPNFPLAKTVAKILIK